jgi:hypothetical protein
MELIFNTSKQLFNSKHGYNLIDKARKSKHKTFRLFVVNDLDDNRIEVASKDNTALEFSDIEQLVKNCIDICENNKMDIELDDQFATIIKFGMELKDLEWTAHEKETLPTKYTKNMIHIALETADNLKEEEQFHLILNGGGKHRKEMLVRHMELTSAVFTWNFKQ